MEQHVPQWDRINASSREPQRAVLDVAVRDLRTGCVTFIDIQVLCGLSTNFDRLRQSAHNSGSAAKEAANARRRRYPAE